MATPVPARNTSTSSARTSSDARIASPSVAGAWNRSFSRRTPRALSSRKPDANRVPAAWGLPRITTGFVAVPLSR